MTDTQTNAQSRLTDVVVTNVTLFADDGAVNLDAIAEHVRFMVDAGIGTVIPCGNTGEFTSLSLDEAKQVVATTVTAANGRAAVVAGIGWSLPTAIELANAADEAGAHAVMVHHPVHTYIDRRGLRAYYERLIEATNLPVIMYKRGPELTDELLREMVAHERVIAVKYAVNDVHGFSRLAGDTASDVVWMCGTAERWAPFFHLAGATSFSSGLANVAPPQALALCAALDEGDYTTAMQIRKPLVPFEDLREQDFGAKNVPAVKEAMRQLGLCSSARVREPLCELSDEDAKLISEVLGTWQLHPKQAIRSCDAHSAKPRRLDAVRRAASLP